MPPLTLALFELRRRPLRSVLCIAAVAFAAALVTTVTALTGTAQAMIEAQLAGIVGSADARIVHVFNGRFPPEIAERVRGWPEVEDAAARLVADLRLARADAPDGPTLDVLALGIDLEREADFRPLAMQRGRRPAAVDEVIIDPRAAFELGVDLGDELIAVGSDAPLRVRVVGIFDRPDLGFLQRPLVRLALPALGAATGLPGWSSAIVLRLRDGVELEPFIAAHQDELPETAALEPADRRRAGFDRRVRASRLFMIVGAMLTFLSASFIIVIALTTAVLERQRELAILRCAGAARGQVAGAQLLLGGMIGLVAGALGVAGGLGLASAIAALFRETLTTGLRPVPLGVGLAFGGAVLASLVGAAIPAHLAAGVRPLAALQRPGRTPRRRTIVAFGVAGAACLAAQLALLGFTDVDVRFWTYFGAGLPLVFLGWFLLACPVTVALARALDRPMSRVLALPRGLLEREARATPLRVGCTAGALMVGMALLVSYWSQTHALFDGWLGGMRFADGFVVRAMGISEAQQAAIADVPGVEAISPVGALPVRILSGQGLGVAAVTTPTVIAVGFEPASFLRLNRVDWVRGDPDTALPRLAAGDGVLVADRFLVARGVEVGDTIVLGGGRTRHAYEIVGVIGAAGLDVATELFGVRSAYGEMAMSCVFLDRRVFAEHYDNADAIIVQTDLAEDADDEAVGAAIEAAAPGVRFRSGRWIRRMLDDLATGVRALQTAVALAAMVLAAFGVGNAIVAGLHARRRWFGVLRAVGAGRGVVSRIILAEAGLLAISGALVGTLAGWHLAWMGTVLSRDVAGVRLRLHPAPDAIALGLGLLLAIALLASAPAALALVRPRPRALLAAGRGG